MATRITAPDAPGEYIFLNPNSQLIAGSRLSTIIAGHMPLARHHQDDVILIEGATSICLKILAQICNRGSKTIASIRRLYKKKIIRDIFVPFTRDFGLSILTVYFDRYFGDYENVEIDITLTVERMKIWIVFHEINVDMEYSGTLVHYRFKRHKFILFLHQSDGNETTSHKLNMKKIFETDRVAKMIEYDSTESFTKINDKEYKAVVRLRLLPQEPV